MKKSYLHIIPILLVLLFVVSGCSAPAANAPASAAPTVAASAGATATSAPAAVKPDPANATFLKYYKAVKIGMTKDEVDKATGLTAVAAKGTYDPEGAYNYADGDGYGVYVLYNSSMKAYSKTVLKRDYAKDLAPLTVKPVTQELCDKITDGMTYADVVKLLGGDGVELSTTAVKKDTTEDISPILYWGNKDGSIIQVVFKADGTTTNAMFFD